MRINLEKRVVVDFNEVVELDHVGFVDLLSSLVGLDELVQDIEWRATAVCDGGSIELLVTGYVDRPNCATCNPEHDEPDVDWCDICRPHNPHTGETA